MPIKTPMPPSTAPLTTALSSDRGSLYNTGYGDALARFAAASGDDVMWVPRRQPGQGFSQSGGPHEPDKYRAPTGFAPSRGLFETALESPFTPSSQPGTLFTNDSSYVPFAAPAPQAPGLRNPFDFEEKPGSGTSYQPRNPFDYGGQGN
jgi:hypothetical protein